MRLKPDCVREILLDVEKRAIYGQTVDYLNPIDFQAFPNYSPNEFFITSGNVTKVDFS